MKFMRTLIVGAASLALVALLGAQDKGKDGGKKGGFTLPPMIKLSITGFSDGGMIPAKYAGAMGVSPAMSWTGAPANTAAYAIIMHDPDPVLANSATQDVLHWAIVNIPGSTTMLPENVKAGDLPDGTKQINNIRGQQAYMGPGPPAGHGAHHYTFTIYGLNAKLDVPPATTKADLLKALDGKVIAKGLVVGLYENK